jgi:hypothetical protein
MQALKRWAKQTLIYVSQQRPDGNEWWEEFVKCNPISARIMEEFRGKYRRKLNRVILPQDTAICYGEKGIKLFEDYYAKRVYELREDPKSASLFMIERKA